jgi:hypothetical protein
MGGMGRGGFGGGISSGGGMGVNPLIGLAGLGMFGMMMRSPYRNMGNMGNQNRKPNGIMITAPNGGEIWTVGSSQNITWTANGLSGNVTIELARDGGSIWDTIVDSTPITGNETWIVTGPATTRGRIRVSSISNNSVVGVSANDFTISDT